MIYPITDVFSIHKEIVEEKNNDMTEFLEKLHAVLDKFEKACFRTPDKRIFKAVLIKRKDVYRETKTIVQVPGHLASCIAVSRVKVILMYTFKEFT